MICTWYFKIVSNFTRLTAREITYNNFEISLVVFMANITTNHAITYTNFDFKYFIAFYLITYPFFILGVQIPSISVTEANMLQHGDGITIFCNITHASWRSELKRISWLKNGVVHQSVRNPDPDSHVPLVIKNAAASDGGKYSCVLEVLLRRLRWYNVSDTVMITSEYTMSLW